MKFLFPKVLGFVAPTPSVVPQNDAAVILNRAADIIEKKGLAQNTFHIMRDGSMCTYTAIETALREKNLMYSPIHHDVKRLMTDQIGYGSIAYWTDSLTFFPKQRVVWNLRRAAAKA